MQINGCIPLKTYNPSTGNQMPSQIVLFLNAWKKFHKILLVDVIPIMFYKWDPSDTFKWVWQRDLAMISVSSFSTIWWHSFEWKFLKMTINQNKNQTFSCFNIVDIKYWSCLFFLQYIWYNLNIYAHTYYVHLFF